MDFLFDKEYMQKLDKTFNCNDKLDELIKDIHIVDNSLKEVLKEKSKNYKELCIAISYKILSLCGKLNKTEEKNFYEMLAFRRYLYTYETVVGYIDGYLIAINLMTEVYGG